MDSQCKDKMAGKDILKYTLGHIDYVKMMRNNKFKKSDAHSNCINENGARLMENIETEEVCVIIDSDPDVDDTDGSNSKNTCDINEKSYIKNYDTEKGRIENYERNANDIFEEFSLGEKINEISNEHNMVNNVCFDVEHNIINDNSKLKTRKSKDVSEVNKNNKPREEQIRKNEDAVIVIDSDSCDSDFNEKDIIIDCVPDEHFLKKKKKGSKMSGEKNVKNGQSDELEVSSDLPGSVQVDSSRTLLSPCGVPDIEVKDDYHYLLASDNTWEKKENLLTSWFVKDGEVLDCRTEDVNLKFEGNNENPDYDNLVGINEKQHTANYNGKGYEISLSELSHVKESKLDNTMKKYFECHICGKKFLKEILAKKHAIQEHLYMHSTVKELDCDILDNKCVKKPCLTEHGIIPGENKPFRCKTCGKKFKWRHGLKQHELLHKDKVLHCNSYNETFMQNNDLKQHELINIDNKPFQCNTCGEQFELNDFLKQHELTHNVKPYLWNSQGRNVKTMSVKKKNDKHFQCTKCDKTFETEGNLQNHEYRFHQLICCVTCGKIFKGDFCHRQHNIVHIKDKPFVCTLCGKTFKSKGQLKQHLLIHSNIKPYRCNTCGECFKRKYSLQVHEVTHTNKLIGCNKCGKTFATKFYLKKHESTHDNIFFHCSLCNKNFKSMVSLYRHELVHHNSDEYLKIEGEYKQHHIAQSDEIA